MAQKPRSDAAPLNQFREELEQWIYEENASFVDIVARLKSQHSFSCSVSSVWRWKQRRDDERLIERIADRAQRSRQVVAAFAEENPALDSSFTQLLQQIAFDVTSSESPDPEMVTKIVGQALKLRQQEISREKLDLARDKFKASIRSKLEEGMAELARAIEANPEAQAAFAKFKAVLIKETA
jgi:hypothetical protein